MYPRDRRGGLARLASESTALMEIGALMALRRRLLDLVPQGDGHPVMLIPGFTATDRAMAYLRRFLDDCGYVASGWEQGRNLGVSRDRLDALVRRVRALVDDSGRQVSLVGWSGGGMYARALGHRLPDAIRQVITLGTPFKLDEDSLDYLPQGIYRLHERLSPRAPAEEQALTAEAWKSPPPVPTSSLFSERDALAPWPFCLDVTDSRSENIHVPGSHAGMTYNPLIYYVLADRLTQQAETWQPFQLGLLRRAFFRHASAPRFWHLDSAEASS